MAYKKKTLKFDLLCKVWCAVRKKRSHVFARFQIELWIMKAFCLPSHKKSLFVLQLNSRMSESDSGKQWRAASGLVKCSLNMSFHATSKQPLWHFATWTVEVKTQSDTNSILTKIYAISLSPVNQLSSSVFSFLSSREKRMSTHNNEMLSSSPYTPI